ncbi:NB-ARC domains-containing protein [Tanacetum coccineum]|uniref:ADP-ribosyl cyclase/cyclic ADP-ribose hydrolase n=1 Tax=Tanacetum coccineum TaxID=301880 RepID=A0ABQ5CPA9_9ASTR
MGSKCISQGPPYLSFLKPIGGDIIQSFVDHLYRDFKRKGILAFKEDDHMRRGEERSPHVFRAIEQSKFLVVILFDGFTSSPSFPEFIGEGYSISTICVEYEWASPGCSSFGHVLDECPKKIDSDVLPNLKKPIQAIRGIPVGSKLKSTFIYRPVQSTKITDKAPAKPKVTKVTNSTTSISNSCDALNTLVDEDDYGGMNSASTQEPEQVEGSGKKDINTSVPTRLCYKTPISVVSSVHKSSLVASDSHNSTPLAERINKLGKQMLDGKLILVDDDVKPLNKVDSDPVDSDSEHEVEVAYDERLNSWLVEVQMMQDYMRTKTMTSMILMIVKV